MLTEGPVVDQQRGNSMRPRSATGAIVMVVALSLATHDVATAQSVRGVPSGSPGGPPLVSREHATGGEVPVLMGVASLSALVIYDIASAPGSARWHNERYPGRPAKSPRTARIVSLGATIIPVTAAYAVSDDAGATSVLVATGLLFGPAAGHWYAGRYGRALGTTALRAAISILTVVGAACCT